jgi:hypothetical protein
MTRRTPHTGLGSVGLVVVVFFGLPSVPFLIHTLSCNNGGWREAFQRRKCARLARYRTFPDLHSIRIPLQTRYVPVALRLPFLINSIELGTTTYGLIGFFHTNTTLKPSQVGLPDHVTRASAAKVEAYSASDRSLQHDTTLESPPLPTLPPLPSYSIAAGTGLSAIFLRQSGASRLQRCVSVSSVFFDVDQ